MLPHVSGFEVLAAIRDDAGPAPHSRGGAHGLESRAGGGRGERRRPLRLEAVPARRAGGGRARSCSLVMPPREEPARPGAPHAAAARQRRARAPRHGGVPRARARDLDAAGGVHAGDARAGRHGRDPRAREARDRPRDRPARPHPHRQRGVPRPVDERAPPAARTARAVRGLAERGARGASAGAAAGGGDPCLPARLLRPARQDRARRSRRRGLERGDPCGEDVASTRSGSASRTSWRPRTRVPPRPPTLPTGAAQHAVGLGLAVLGSTALLLVIFGLYLARSIARPVREVAQGLAASPAATSACGSRTAGPARSAS